ncbi:Phthiocerol synthesis polyketide synthase type I PpsC [Enhygromyxa salina]|uniref:Phthiocerol synthesis polyketide synthase type I PpsC n=1 Tax=Enhygromyxa salina TaxID=215803 RepID=A0A2S9Y0J9_9BACT|nr:NADPH:quinone oxidoreductase family protein [Enhygromyxa salina]PRP98500.1 Phthiocerol synthesis polyketide synthase type I PpsC [Enhygromyxa salina]
MSAPGPGQRVVVREFGETPLDALAAHVGLVAQAYPEVDGLGPRDVIVEVRSAAVGWVDLLMTSGQYQHMPAPPYCPGLEYAGVVAWTGAEVEGLRVGDSVLSDGLRTGPRSLGPYQQWGGFASYAVAPAEGLLPLPAGLSFDQGCNLLGNYETAYHCLIHRGRLAAGEVVLINGATGSTGLAAVDLAKRVGATVIATGRSAAKLEQVAARGADHVVVIGADLGFRDEVKALTGGRGVDVVYDPVGGKVSLESLRCVTFGARFLVVGWASTPFVARGKGQRGAPNANVLPTNLIMMKSLDVLGCPAAISAHRDPSLREARLRDLLAWVAAGEISPHVDARYPLAEVHEAMRAKWDSRFVGGVVVNP